jgi:uncharacterized cupredoxin-like copper-binding protein
MRKIVGLIILLSTTLLAACGGSVEPVSYTIEMDEYTFSPSTIEVKVGQEVTIELVNKGEIPHELMIGRGVDYIDRRPVGYVEDMFSIAHVEPEVTGGVVSMGDGHDMDGHAGFMVVLEGIGDTATIKFTATREMVGEWEMGCFEQDGVHYDAGMVGKLIVSP